MILINTDLPYAFVHNDVNMFQLIKMSSESGTELDDWDVDSYKTDHEPADHWQLRRSFMIAHKDRIPEDELVCLAQVFTNIEFLGCR